MLVTKIFLTSTPPAARKRTMREILHLFSVFRRCILHLHCFCLVVAQIVYSALPAQGFLRLAHLAAMQNQPVVGIKQKFFRNKLHQPIFHFAHIFARCQAGAVGHTENMRIHSHNRLAESSI